MCMEKRINMTTHSDNQITTDEENIEKFKSVVLKDVKNESSLEEKEYLMQNAAFWLYILQVTRRDVEFQLSSQKSKEKIALQELLNSNHTKEQIIDYNKRKDKWRMNAIKFLSAIEKKTLYVKILIKSQNANK